MPPLYLKNCQFSDFEFTIATNPFLIFPQFAAKKDWVDAIPILDAPAADTVLRFVNLMHQRPRSLVILPNKRLIKFITTAVANINSDQAGAPAINMLSMLRIKERCDDMTNCCLNLKEHLGNLRWVLQKDLKMFDIVCIIFFMDGLRQRQRAYLVALGIIAHTIFPSTGIFPANQITIPDGFTLSKAATQETRTTLEIAVERHRYIKNQARQWIPYGHQGENGIGIGEKLYKLILENKIRAEFVKWSAYSNFRREKRIPIKMNETYFLGAYDIVQRQCTQDYPSERLKFHLTNVLKLLRGNLTEELPDHLQTAIKSVKLEGDYWRECDEIIKMAGTEGSFEQYFARDIIFPIAFTNDALQTPPEKRLLLIVIAALKGKELGHARTFLKNHLSGISSADEMFTKIKQWNTLDSAISGDPIHLTSSRTIKWTTTDVYYEPIVNIPIDLPEETKVPASKLKDPLMIGNVMNAGSVTRSRRHSTTNRSRSPYPRGRPGKRNKDRSSRHSPSP